MHYSVKQRIKTITQNTTINDTDFSGWMAVNTGLTPVYVNKIRLQAYDGLDFTNIQPNVKWDSPIQIVIPETGGEVTLIQLIYKQTEGDSLTQLVRGIFQKMNK